MKERIARFMAGRNGIDQLNIFLLLADLVLALLSGLLSGALGRILHIVVLLVLVLVYYRMLSRDLVRRREENGKYLRLRYRVSAWFRLRKERWVQRKEYKFFVCPACRTTLRVPRGRGKLRIVCRKCGRSFTGKS